MTDAETTTLEGRIVARLNRWSEWLEAWAARIRKNTASQSRKAVPDDGLRAPRQGCRLEDNPFPKHTPDHSIWRDDWLDANGRRM